MASKYALENNTLFMINSIKYIVPNHITSQIDLFKCKDDYVGMIEINYDVNHNDIDFVFDFVSQGCIHNIKDYVSCIEDMFRILKFMMYIGIESCYLSIFIDASISWLQNISPSIKNNYDGLLKLIILLRKSDDMPYDNIIDFTSNIIIDYSGINYAILSELMDAIRSSKNLPLKSKYDILIKVIKKYHNLNDSIQNYYQKFNIGSLGTTFEVHENKLLINGKNIQECIPYENPPIDINKKFVLNDVICSHIANLYLKTPFFDNLINDGILSKIGYQVELFGLHMKYYK